MLQNVTQGTGHSCSLVSTETSLRAAGRLGFNSRQGQMMGIMPYATASTLPLGPTHLLVRCVPAALTPWLKGLRREAVTPPVRLHGAVLG